MPAKKATKKVSVRRKKTTKPSTISVKIGRMNTPTGTYDLEPETSIEEALSAVGLVLNSSETVWLNGDKADMDTVLENNDVIQIVVKKDGGLV